MVPKVTTYQREVLEIGEDDEVLFNGADGCLETFKLPIDDQKLCCELKKIWESRGEAKVFFTFISACGQEKIISGEYKKKWFSMIKFHQYIHFFPLENHETSQKIVKSNILMILR